MVNELNHTKCVQYNIVHSEHYYTGYMATERTTQQVANTYIYTVLLWLACHTLKSVFHALA